MISLERLTARWQGALSLLFMFSYFGLKVLVGLKKLDASLVNDLTPLFAVVVGFWFARHRNVSPTEVTPSRPTQPPEAAQTGAPSK